MRKLSFLIAGMALVFAVCGCQDKKNSSKDLLSAGDGAEDVADTTIYGKCVAAAMNSFSIVNEKGDTVDFVLETADATGDVQGGKFEGDKMAVISEKVDGENFAKKVINITSLLGKWTSLDKNFEIKDDGVVESRVTAEASPYTSWRILNGKLLLSADTFEVLNLGPDSLYLENSQGIFVYKRQR